MENANKSIWKRMIKDRKKWLLDRSQFFHQNCPVELLNQNRTRSLCTFWSQNAVGEQRSKFFWSGSVKKLQWSLKTFLRSHRHSRHAKSIFNDTSKRLTTRSCWKVYEFLHFFQFIKRSLKILLWTCILDFAEDQLNFYPTFEKKHKDLKFSKLGYLKNSSGGYTQRMQNTSPRVFPQSWKKSKFWGVLGDFLFLKRHSRQDKCCFNNATWIILLELGENGSLKNFAKDFNLTQNDRLFT